ncbi:MAG: hypothetical protein GY868_21540 [Deltaproteobacteria bacterium]|nr:hypothetical protein [Deltaproteobacteria bacterium]
MIKISSPNVQFFFPPVIVTPFRWLFVENSIAPNACRSGCASLNPPGVSLMTKSQAPTVKQYPKPKTLKYPKRENWFPVEIVCLLSFGCLPACPLAACMHFSCKLLLLTPEFSSCRAYHFPLAGSVPLSDNFLLIAITDS